MTGERDEALAELDRSERRIAPSTMTFDCWSYRYVAAEKLLEQLSAMRAEIVAGRIATPPIVMDVQTRE